MQNTETQSDLIKVGLAVRLLLTLVAVILTKTAATHLGLETDPFTLRGIVTLVPAWFLLDYLFEHIGRKFGYHLGMSRLYPGNWKKA